MQFYLFIIIIIVIIIIIIIITDHPVGLNGQEEPDSILDMEFFKINFG